MLKIFNYNLTDFIIFNIISSVPLEEGLKSFFANLTETSKIFTMQISLQTIIDIVLNTIQRLYKTQMKITSTSKDKNYLKFILEDEQDTIKKYDVEIWLEYDERNNEFIIRTIELGLLIKTGDFPAYIGAFTCSNLIEFNQATTTTLKGARFKVVELLEVA